MAYDGTLKFDTSLDANGFQKGANKLGSIVKGLSVFKVLSAGVDMVKSSVDAAFGRIDTMEQFGRVMNVMTGDTAKTNKALEKTNSIVKGTAYGLDVASKAVQSFVSRGMGVDKSTKTLENFADAVAFYGDGTNATFQSVTDALGKMQTKGNVTMEHLEMLFNAGIPAVEIYANAVGVSTSDVTKAMSKGQLKTDDFINTLNKAFQTGVEGFPSVAGAAKEAGASWTGTFDNMKAAITRGTQAIITNIDKALESVGKPSLRESIANFGKTFENVLKGIAGAAGPIVKHLDLIAFGVSSVAVAFAGYQAVEKWNAAVAATSAVIDAAIKNESTCVVALTAGQRARLNEASATAKQVAAEKARLAVTAQTKAEQLSAVAVTAQATAAKAAETAETLKSTAAKNAEAATAARARAEKALELAENLKIKASKAAETFATSKASMAKEAETAAIMKASAAKRADEYASRRLIELSALQQTADLSATAAKEAEAVATATATAAQTAELTATSASTAAKTAEIAATDASTAATATNIAALSVKQVIIGVLSGEIGVATAAQWAWNAAMYANPIGMMVAALGVLLVAIVGINKALESHTTAYKENKKAIEETITVQEDLAKSIDEGRNSYEESSKTEKERVGRAQELISTLNQLSRIENKSADDKLKISSTVRQLNTMYNELNLSYDDENDKLNQNTKAVQEYIEAQSNISEAAQAQERLTAIQDAQIANEKTIEGLQKKKNQLIWDYYNTNKYTTDGYKKQLGELNAIEKTYYETKESLSNEAIELEKKIKDTNTGKAQQIIDNYEWLNTTMTKNGQTAQELADEWGITGDEMINLFKELNVQSLDELVKTVQENTKEWQETFESHKDAVINSFEEIPTKFGKSADQMNKTLNDNAAKYSEWQENISKLSGIMSAEAIAELEKLGPAANSLIKEYLENTDKAEEFEEAFQKNMQAAVDGANKDLPRLTDTGEKAGEYIGEGISKSPAIPEAVKTQLTEVGKQIDTSMQELADNVDTTKLSAAMESGIETGIKNGTKSILTVFAGLKEGLRGQWDEISKLCINSVTSIMLQTQVGFRVGTDRAHDIVKAKLQDIHSTMLTGGTYAALQLVNGMIVGLTANAWRLNAKADQLAQGVISRMNKAFDINSPSRVTEAMFRYVVMGGVKGFDDEKDTLYSKADEINAEILDRLEADPELCASMVERMREIASYTPWDTARLSPALSPAYAGAGMQYTSNFTQIINSHEALSPSEMSQEAVDAQRRLAWKIP